MRQRPLCLRMAVACVLAASCSSAKPGNPTNDLAVADLSGGDIDGAPPANDAGNPDGGENGGRVCNGSTLSLVAPGPTPEAVPFAVAPGFAMQKIAQVHNARQLAALPNGDLLVGTSDESIYIVPNAEDSGRAGAPSVFVTIPDRPVQGVTFVQSSCTIYVGTQNGVYSIPYSDGDLTGTANKIAAVRSGPLATSPDDKHITTSVAFTGGSLYVSVGSSCNACAENDANRAAILQMGPNGENLIKKATHIRNAIALAVNPATQTLWAGGAGQDNVKPIGHPFEFFDAVTLHKGVADYGWPNCEENQVVEVAGSDCSGEVEPLVELPAYQTIIGAVFYPTNQTGTHAFPAANRGLYLAGHGSWHMTGGKYYTAPRVAFVPWKSGDAPKTPVTWDIKKVEAPVTGGAGQWSEFISGYLAANGVDRSGRPTGLAIGVQGSLFIGDDQNGAVYRVRPTP